jgi:site-specific recombinase XerD
MGRLRVVSTTSSGGELEGAALERFHEELIARYFELCECMNFMPTTGESNVAMVRYALRKLGLSYVWDITSDEVRRFNSILVSRGVSARTRAKYCSSLKTVCAFLLEEHASEIALRTGRSMQQPVTRRNTPRTQYGATYSLRAPPTQQSIRKISQRLRQQLPFASSFPASAQGLAIFETLYLTATRSQELLMLDVADIYPRKGSSGELHIRFGKGARGSGHRVRWVPMLDGLDALLAWYVADVRPSLKPSRKQQALFLDGHGDRLCYTGLCTVLRQCLRAARIREQSHFTPHRLRHARASHLFASGMNIVAVQKLLGHEFLATTQRYVHVDASFVAKAHKEMVGRTLDLSED